MKSPLYNNNQDCTMNQMIVEFFFGAKYETILFRYRFILLIKLTTTFVIISFSSGLLSAIIRAIATRALSVIRFEPSARYRILFFAINHTNKNAAMRLLPSEKEWFFITKYNRLGGFFFYARIYVASIESLVNCC